jgi:hypothetical protein
MEWAHQSRIVCFPVSAEAGARLMIFIDAMKAIGRVKIARRPPIERSTWLSPPGTSEQTRVKPYVRGDFIWREPRQ